MKDLARLVAKTMPVIDDINDANDFVAYVARVSNPANQNNSETAPRLLAYLRKNQHWSPFEMAHAVIEINTTRDIARQILRHRSFSFQEFSQRYSSEIEMAEPREVRLQDAKNRQSSNPSYDISQAEWWADEQAKMAANAKLLYGLAIEQGIAKEVARAVLPEGLTMSRLYMAGSLRSWVHYIELRAGNGTQKEHRLVAEACRDVLAEAFPSIFGEHNGQ